MFMLFKGDNMAFTSPNLAFLLGNLDAWNRTEMGSLRWFIVKSPET